VIWSLCLLVPLPAAWPAEDKKADDKGMKIKGRLIAEAPKEQGIRKAPQAAHEIKMGGGKAYQIDVATSAFHSLLRLEDSSGKQLAQDKDSGGPGNARIKF